MNAKSDIENRSIESKDKWIWWQQYWGLAFGGRIGE